MPWVFFLGCFALAMPVVAQIPREVSTPPRANLSATDTWVGKLLGTCKQQGNWILYALPGSKSTKKLPITECTFPDGQGKEYFIRSCILLSDTWTLLEKPAACGTNQQCYVGICKYPALQALPAKVCTDSDHPKPTFPWTPPPGSGLPAPTLPPDDPQIFQPGKITVSQGAKKTQDFADSCKGPLLIESVCTGAGPQQSQQVAVQCPPSFQCNPQAEMNGVIGAACDEVCPPPYVDMCSDPGCQQLLIECTEQPPDPCSPIDPATQYPNATIFGSPGNWHIDLCLPEGSDTVGHYQCKEGKANLGITKCEAPDLCFNGLCNGKPPPEPEEAQCKDTDPPIPPTGKPFGNTKIFGMIKIDGAGFSAANDYCDLQNQYMVWQAKCSPLDPAGYTFGTNPTLCPNDPDGTALVCVDGVCVKPSPCQCAESPDNGAEIPGKAEGTKQSGTPFTAYDQCQGDLLLKAECESWSVNCHAYAPKKCFGENDEIAICVSVPLGGICKPVSQASCSDTDAANDEHTVGKVTGISKLQEKFEKNDFCFSNTTLKQVSCDTSDWKGYVLAPFDCTPEFCADGICVPCTDDDVLNDTHVKGTVQTSDLAKHTDYCPVEGEKLLTQVSCGDDGMLLFGTPAPCPGNELCKLGVCKPKSDMCGAGVPPDGNACTTDACNPATGAPQYTPVQDGTACDDGNLCTEASACVAGKCAGGLLVSTADADLCTKDTCDPKEGIAHTPVTCPAGKLCHPKTGVCGNKADICNGNGIVDLSTEKCDKDDLQGLTCQTLDSKFSGGILTCTTSCTFDTSGCYACGNKKHEPNEQCEKIFWKNYASMDPVVYCTTFFPPPVEGDVDCNSATCKFILNCEVPGDPYGSPPTPGTPLDLSFPPATCGNWVVDSGEECDHLNLAGKSCVGFGYGWGWLSCSLDCKFIKNCFGTPSDPYGLPPASEDVPTCGNGFKDQGEACDPMPHPTKPWGPNFFGHVCSDFGFFGGLLQCSDDCKINKQLCYGLPGDPYGGSQHCGDGAIDPGEECDGKPVPCNNPAFISTGKCGKYCQMTPADWTCKDPSGSP